VPATIGVDDAYDTNLNLIQYGKVGSILTHGNGGYVTFEVICHTAGVCRISATLASMMSRPFTVYVNGGKTLEKVGAGTTGGWDIGTAKRFELGTIVLTNGINMITLTNCGMGHFTGLASITIE
jgi:hypothetical protein